MHPYTVYGIETTISAALSQISSSIACTLIPFTVLKRVAIDAIYKAARIACTLIPFTVLKRQVEMAEMVVILIACTLIPFTVLKLLTVFVANKNG